MNHTDAHTTTDLRRTFDGNRDIRHARRRVSYGYFAGYHTASAESDQAIFSFVR